MTELNTNDQHEEILIELIQMKDCLSLFSKTTIAQGEVISSNEINAIFTLLSQKVDSISEKYQKII
ncbi:hypothetical protein [Acinetobacter bereziniae]|uniref:hypothetical protein n=1 Tax=Acinetobacter bereziniae TaxID=106648 RepID=UPI002578938C|nr:hypothetical protein [Acinetobacter bereziniae]MDM1784244.1 hypothetical protein [Acinetobacter bereziniae]